MQAKKTKTFHFNKTVDACAFISRIAIGSQTNLSDTVPNETYIIPLEGMGIDLELHNSVVKATYREGLEDFLIYAASLYNLAFTVTETVLGNNDSSSDPVR